MQNWRLNLENAGFAIVPAVVESRVCQEILKGVEAAPGEGVKRRESVYAVRNLLEIDAVRDLARSAEIRALTEPILGPNCFAVRGIWFDKTPDANWKVVWHQDLSIAVKEKREIAGFGPWSQKAGAVHVQPPVEILEKMLTVRLHLDDCDAQNGPLKVLAGTHRLGRLSAAQIAAEREKAEEKCV